MRIRATHNVRVRAWREGRLVRQFRKSNLVVTAGLDLLSQAVLGEGDGISHIAVGDDNTAPAAGQTSLVSEVYRDQLTSSDTDGSGGASLTLYVGTNRANGETLRESGLFTADAGGTMLARVAFSAAEEIAKDNTISVEISWDLTFSNA